ncbi:MAG TPA: YIEGIA family protein [Oscillospiraceae bacterium]|nr:YIEGIA family protein [Oscillospiraceae bacterium]
MNKDILTIICGVTMGTIARYWMMRRDFRQYPSYPHATVTHLALGFVAATLGAVAIPAIAAKEYTAVTFLTLAATQFRDVRNMEREMLVSLDQSTLVSRGADFIEGIARTFEARNYLVVFVSLNTSLFTYLYSPLPGIVAGAIALTAVRRFMRGKLIGDIAKVRPAKVHFDGANLFVEDIHIMNLALPEVKKVYEEMARGVVLEPISDNGREILANVGQRQAIAHDVALLLGVRRDVDTAEFTPLLRRKPETGRVGMVIVPIEPDIECLVAAVQNVPVLESAFVQPLKSRIGRSAAD